MSSVAGIKVSYYSPLTTQFVNPRVAHQSIALLLFACLPISAEPIGTEFKGIQLSRPVIGRHPSLGTPNEDESTLPDLTTLDRLINSENSEPILFIELVRDEDDRFAPLYSPDGKRLAFVRADIERKSSKIEILENLATGAVRTVLPEEESYDYMFAWRHGYPSLTDFCFASTAGPEQTMNLFLATSNLKTTRLTNTRLLKKHPDFRVTAQGAHQLLYEMEGLVMLLEFDDVQRPGEPRQLAEGSFPAWSPDGKRYASIKTTANAAGTHYSLVLRQISGAEEVVILPQLRPLMSPTWSPDGAWLAFYMAGQAKGRYDLMTVSTAGGPSRLIAQEVVVETNFDHTGPAWSRDSKQIFFFALKSQEGVVAVEESYYRLLSRENREGAPLQAFDYDRRYTTAIAPVVNPGARYPEVTFSATRGLSQGIYVLILNHLGN